MNKSKCCGADVRIVDTCGVGNTNPCPFYCPACGNFCGLAPALRDSKEVLEFVEKEIEELNKIPFVFKCLLRQAEKIKNFIEEKE